MFVTNVDKYKLFGSSDRSPYAYREIYYEDALLVDEVDLDIKVRDPRSSNFFFLAVSDINDLKHYILVVLLGYSPSEPTFHPEVLLIPETKLLYIGAGERILVYDLNNSKRLLKDVVRDGFIRWARYGQYIIMLAEMEIAVLDIYGKKLWSQLVEPPWEYSIEDQLLHLHVQERHFSFSLDDGPSSITFLRQISD